MKSMCLAAALLLTTSGASSADVLKLATVGCTAPGDAEKIAALQARKDKAGADAMARPLVVSRACIDFAKGVTVGVDERRLPLACVRLTGDLSCYWIAAAIIDEHPGQKGGGARRGAHRR